MELPEEIGRCRLLESLDLRKNELTALPRSLAQCSCLSFMHLGNNRISLLEPALCEALVNLREVYLCRNKLEALPPQVGCMVNMTKISLSGNNMK
ncbi:unnamed protein product, partial [Discosporangium mesarthrocarpum]